MIISPNKAADITDRLKLLEDMEMDLRAGRVKTAQAIGVMTNWLAHKIAHHDYSKLDELDRKWKTKSENYSPQ